MSKIEHLKSELAELRDEAKVQVELGRMELREEWGEIEAKWDRFVSEARLQQSEDGIKAALATLADELRAAYRRFKAAF